MPHYLDQAAQNAYSDLYAACLNPAFDGKGISFTQKEIKGKRYVYISTKIGRVPIQKYIGPVGPETQSLIEQERELWGRKTIERGVRARLVNMVLAGGIQGPSPQEGKILRMLERAGVFLAGGILIGTPAFRVLGASLGTFWEGQFATRDVDLAVDYRLPVVVEAKTVNLKSVLEESGMGFIEIPTLNPKHPSTSYKMRGGEFSVELLTPELGPPSSEPIKIPYLNAMAEPVRFLEFLLQETQPAVVAFDIGILVNVPDPARFAIHKLVISQRRPTAFAAKSAKDIDQARQLLSVLLDVRPGAVMAAIEAAASYGGKFEQQLNKGIKLLPKDLQNSLVSWMG